MSGSGTNRLVQSENAKEGGSEEKLASELRNANESAIKASSMKKATESVMKK